MHPYKEMFYVFKYGFNIIKRGIRNGYVLRTHEMYLENGVYINTINGDYIYEVSSYSKIGDKTYSSLSLNNGQCMFLLNVFTKIFKYKINGNKKKKFCGTELLLSSSGNEIKIFSKKKGLVMTCYKDKNKFLRSLDEKYYFSQYYDVPKTVEFDIDNKTVVELLIPHHDYSVDNAFFYYCERFSLYLQTNKDSIMYDIEEDKKKLARFRDCVGPSKLLNHAIGLPKIVTHGDLWRSNIIYDGKNFYLIDFEKKGIRFFLFDFFCFIFSECYLLYNRNQFNFYLKGGYDEVLSKLFKEANSIYDKNLRETYFIAFLVEYSHERWNTEKTSEIVSNFLKEYLPKYFLI